MKPVLEPPWKLHQDGTTTCAYTKHTAEPPWKSIVFLPLHKALEGWSHIRFQGSSIEDTKWQELSQIILNSKEKITEISNTDIWEQQKKITNAYEYIFAMSDQPTGFPTILKSLQSGLSPLSRSYFKMIELLHVADFWKGLKEHTGRGGAIISAHVCEGPGGFIQAFIDQAKKKHVKVATAYAMTLKPTKQHIPGWRRSISFLRAHREVILHYGADGTGDITTLENQKSFEQKVGKKAILFTADGGFDFSMDYSKQEQLVLPLLLSSFLLGVQTLHRGGFMVVKLFDIFLPITRHILTCIGLCFEDFTLYKPATSRPCNSERYFIGRRFLGIPPSIVVYLQQLLITIESKSSFIETPFDSELSGLFHEQAKYQAEQQISAIQSCLTFSESQKEEFMKQGMELSRSWVSTFMSS
jgi:FtsJ-like methyltransferase